jgi:U4/U6.U5 tri-snRNP-associated protein 1
LAAAVLKQEPDEEMSNDQSEQQSGTMVLNVMSEFCRSLGEIPTYGMAGNRVEEEDELVVCI